jgi:hypothetical protein
MDGGDATWERILQAVVFVGVSTLVLTATFLGLVALVSGQLVGVEARLPGYVLAMAVAFIGGLLAVEAKTGDGRQGIATAGGLAVSILVLVTLAGEGVAFALRQPQRLVVSQVLSYVVAAGVLATGLTYWTLLHWREFVPALIGR